MNRTKTIGVVVHHTVTDGMISQEALRAIFKSRFNVNYIGYNLVILRDGSTYSDIGDDAVGIHNNAGEVNNYTSAGICLAGDFEKEEPSKEQLTTLSNELKRLLKKYNLTPDKIYGHRDLKATGCPGENLYNKKPWLLEVSMPYTAGNYKQDFEKMSERDKHFIAMEWAYRSIYLKEPTDAKIWGLVDKYGDIQEARQIMLIEKCNDGICEQIPCPPCDCSKELAEQNKKLNEYCEKKVNDAIKGLISKDECPPCPAIDDLSAGELIARGLRKFLGIK